MSNKRPRSKEKDDLVNQFCAITGASKTVGEQLLEACNNDLQMAIGMQLDGAGDGRGDASVADPAAGNVAATAVPSSTSDLEDGADVRAPIPQRSEVLVSDTAPNYGWRTRRRAARSVFDAFRDFQAEARQQEQQQEAGPSTSAHSASKRKTLEDLFRPPIDLLHKGSFQSAKESGTSRNKWLLVNIQNVKEFSCQMLNRDVWSNKSVKDIIQSGFIFWQVYHDSEEGQKYSQFYKVTDWPYIAILDPITGENLAVWKKMDAKSLGDLLAEFLSERPTPDGSPTGPPLKKAKRNSIVDASEDSQMEAAIQASLQETHQQQDNLLQYDSPEDSAEEGSDDLETFTDSDDPDDLEPDDKDGADGNLPQEKTVVVSSEETESSRESASSVKVIKHSNSAATKSQGQKKSKCGKNSAENGVFSSSIAGSTSNAKSVTTKNSWKDFLGCDEDAKSKVLLRFPDGKRQQFEVSHSSKLQSLVLFAAEQGFPSDRYELVTNFPKRNLLSLDRDISLKEAGLFPQETVFIQER